MPRLLILCEYPTMLGGERSMLATLGAVSAAGFDVHVAAPPGGPLAEALYQQHVSYVPWQTTSAAERKPLERLRTDVHAMLEHVRPDLVHGNSLSTARIAGPVAQAFPTASVGHLRDIVKLSPQAVADLNAHRRLIAVSQATRDFHVVQGIDAPRCVVIRNGVDLKLFRPRPPTHYLHRELNLPNSARFVATIGQLGLRKGTDAALSAAWQVAHDLPDVHWLIVGERTSNKQESHDFAALLHEIANEPPVAGRVHFLGAREDVSDLLCECEILVHAARQEPLGRVLLEAAASGIAIVATDVGGTREIFPTEGDGAALVQPNDSSALATEVGSILTNDQRRRGMAHAARRRAQAAFDIEFAAKLLIQLYQAVLSEER
jgi:glycosyltransferase involved in cell wall biosynthesis